MKTTEFVLSLLVIISFITGCRKSGYMIDETVSIQDNGAGTGTTTWTNDKSYLLEGFVYVNDGQVLTIEAGTVIRAKTGQGTAASALIVARGGKLIARGTAAEPIIFTCEGDDLKGSIQTKARGLWGGVIILGNARLNSEYNENSIEGIPISEPRGVYGGNFDEDNSGILQYLSIRHGGTNIGEGNEINGLTLGGVGSGTTIDHIEVISNADDGFEFFGGTVSCKYLLSVFCGDDGFDYDEGYHGYGQFWVSVQDNLECNHLCEANGGIDPENGRPYSIPLIYNSTFVGAGKENNTALCFSKNAGGHFGNCIFVNQTGGISIEYKEGLEDSYKQFEKGNLKIMNNLFDEISGNNPNEIIQIRTDFVGDLGPQYEILRNYFPSAGNSFMETGISYSDEDYRLIPEITDFGTLAEYPNNWFDAVEFKGAFGSFNWASGWTLLSQSGYLSD